MPPTTGVEVCYFKRERRAIAFDTVVVRRGNGVTQEVLWHRRLSSRREATLVLDSLRATLVPREYFSATCADSVVTLRHRRTSMIARVSSSLAPPDTSAELTVFVTANRDPDLALHCGRLLGLFAEHELVER